jgi:hypothetical protein
MSDDSGFKIVKVGGSTSTKKEVKSRKKTELHKKPKFGVLKGGKTARNKPRFEGVKDPAKAPPVKKGLRILTEKGAVTRRAKIVAEAKRKPIREIRETLRRHNLNVRENTPEHLARKIYEDAQEAGMISSS